MSSTINHLSDLPEQICYVQCDFCTTILLVSVPCSSLSRVVTVRCGHCTSLLSVSMIKASFVPLHLLASLHHDHDEPKEEKVCKEDEEVEEKGLNRISSPSMVTSSDNEDQEDIISVNRIVNKPPEKRQRAPSAYNRFIKEEIKRLKAENPNMAHKEAFSTAAKNWAHFPPIQYKGDGESGGQEDEKATCNSDCTHDQVHVEGNCFRKRKAPRHSILEKSPFE